MLGLFKEQSFRIEFMNSRAVYFIIGGGYLGQTLASRLNNERVCISSRQASKLKLFRKSGLQALCLDINDCADGEWLNAFENSQSLKVCYLIPPSQVDLSRFADFLRQLQSLPIERAVMTSSTVVYGKPERTVDADSDVSIDSERAQKQMEIEQLWQAVDDKFYTVRLAGLYGPDRVIGKRQLLNNAMITSDPQAWLNLIHVQDAADLLVSVINSSTANTIELGCDNQPVRRQQYYSWLANRLNTNSPVFQDSDSFRGGNRKCSNRITQQRTGWSPEFQDYQQGLSPLLD